jgi:hypothetical protein
MGVRIAILISVLCTLRPPIAAAAASWFVLWLRRHRHQLETTGRVNYTCGMGCLLYAKQREDERRKVPVIILNCTTHSCYQAAFLIENGLLIRR